MECEIRKNQKISYQAYPHAKRSECGTYYCRAVNAVIPDEMDFCKSCPLFGGALLDEAGEMTTQCWYYDMNYGYSDFMSPAEKKERVDSLINLGLAYEFPDYLADDEKGGRFNVIEQALKFAAVAHKGGVRKGSKVPYIAHPIESAMICATMTQDVEVIAAAALHDTIEDTRTTYEDLMSVFSEKIVKLVASESEDKRRDRSAESTWRIRKEENINHARHSGRDVKIIMLADKLSNMRSSLRDFKKCGVSMWDKFNMKDPAQQEWYYREIADVLAELKEYDAYREYVQIVDVVFGKN